MKPADRPICPSCGEANACASAASGSFDVRCWCQDVVIDAAALARLPADQRGKACLCRRCATGALAESTAPITAKD
jgi:hypothetical protein